MLHPSLKRLETIVFFVAQSSLDGVVETARRKIGLNAGIERVQVLVEPYVQFFQLLRLQRADGAFDFLTVFKPMGLSAILPGKITTGGGCLQPASIGLAIPGTHAGTSGAKGNGRGLRSCCPWSPRSAVPPRGWSGACGRCRGLPPPVFRCFCGLSHFVESSPCAIALKPLQTGQGPFQLSTK
jgi:hypothetical protein